MSVLQESSSQNLWHLNQPGNEWLRLLHAIEKLNSIIYNQSNEFRRDLPFFAELKTLIMSIDDVDKCHFKDNLLYLAGIMNAIIKSHHKLDNLRDLSYLSRDSVLNMGQLERVDECTFIFWKNIVRFSQVSFNMYIRSLVSDLELQSILTKLKCSISDFCKDENIIIESSKNYNPNPYPSCIFIKDRNKCKLVELNIDDPNYYRTTWTGDYDETSVNTFSNSSK